MKTKRSEYLKSVNSKMRCIILIALMLCVAVFVLVANLHRAERKPRPSAVRELGKIVGPEDDEKALHRSSVKARMNKPRKYIPVDNNMGKFSSPTSLDKISLHALGQKHIRGDNVDLPMRVQKKFPVNNADLSAREQTEIPPYNVALPMQGQKNYPGGIVDLSASGHTDIPPYNVALPMQGQKNLLRGIVDLSVPKQRNLQRYNAGQPARKAKYVTRGKYALRNVDQPVRDIIWKDSAGKNDPSEEVTVMDLPRQNTTVGDDSSVQHFPLMKVPDFDIEEWRRNNEITVKNNVKYWKGKNALAVKNWQGKNTALGELISVNDSSQKNSPAIELSIEKWKSRNSQAAKNLAKYWKEKDSPLDDGRDKDLREKKDPSTENRVKDSASEPLGLQTGEISVIDTPWGKKSTDDVRMKGSPYYHQNVNFLKELAFLPLYPITCEELFEHVTRIEKSGFFTLEFLVGLRSLNEHLGRILKQLDVTYVETHSGLFEKQQLATVRLVQMPFVRTVCETGFNAGHSTLLYLMANRNAQVYSFDIADHAYSKQMALYIQNEYPGRLHVTWGDSTNTIRDFHGHFPRVTCDVISVDGGQTTDVAYWDFVNFRKMAACRHLVLFNNYPDVQRKSSAIGRVWEGKKRSGELSELFKCQYKTKVHGFSLGRYNDLENCDQQ